MAGPDGGDDRFRQLFAEEARDRIARLSEGLVELEAAGRDDELVRAIFREAHSLKGGAAMLGLDRVTAVAHALEDLIAQLRDGERLATPELVDTMLAGTDSIGRLVLAAVRGEDHAVEAAEVETRLRAASERLPEGAAEAPVAVVPPTTSASAGAAGRPAETLQVPVARLDELGRLVTESAARQLRLGGTIRRELGRDAETISDFRLLTRSLNELQELTMRARMVPVSTVTHTLHRAVRELARGSGKEVRWETRGDETELDRQILEQLADALLHLVRNAVDHGIESPSERTAAGKPREGSVLLHAMQLGSEVVIAISDDGRGIDVERVRAEARRRGGEADQLSDEEALYLVFRSGLSTSDFVTDVSGRGVGLDVVRARLDAVRGRVEVQSEPGRGSEFRIAVPITLAMLPCLLVRAGAQRFGIPLHSVMTALPADGETRLQAEGRDLVMLGERAVPISGLADVLGTGGTSSGPAVVLSGRTRTHAFRVDELIGQREVVVTGTGRLLPRMRALAGASVEPDGAVLVVLDPPGLIDRARRSGRARRTEAAEPAGPPAAPARVLVVDDALTVRELQRSILERAGYEVRTAADGAEALALLAEVPADLVLTDVEMPRMDGFALTEAIRAHPGLANTPVIILTSRASEEDRRRGLEAGADGYIVKSAFDQGSLLSAVDRLLGRDP